MMQSFLMAAHDERDEHKVIKTWVQQVRDVAYDVEDCLQDFAVRLEKQSWWRNPRTLRDRRRVAKRMKDLRAKVEDVSQRNVRYRIFQGSSGSKPTNTADQSSSSASATMFGIDEARRAAKQDKPKVDLVQLINKEDKDLRVIAVWGTSGDLGQTSIIKRAYDDLKICEKFECRAWIRLMHPFDPTEFMQSIMRQFNANSSLQAGNIQEKATLSRAQVLKNMGKIKEEDLIDKFIDHVDKKSFLIVLNGLLTIEDWDWIKMYFLNNKNGSRIIVSTEKVEVASLCAGQESQVSQLKQLSAEQTLYVFCEKDSQDGVDSTKAPGSSSNLSITGTNNSSTVPIGEILEEQSKGADGKSLTRIETMVAALSESELVGRVREKSEIIALISKDSQQVEVISVWGMGGLGKTTLVKDIYQSQELNGMFEKRACVTVMRPFSREELLRSLVMQLAADTFDDSTKKTSPLNMRLEDLIKELSKLLEKKRCLVVLDDLSSTAEWDLIITSFPEMENTSQIIVTTREENIAKHCSKKQENIYRLEGLQYKDAVGLFTKKDSQDGMDSTKAQGSISNSSITSTNNSSTVPIGEIQEEQSKGADGKKVVGKSLTRIETMVAAFSESELVGRVKEKSDIIALISKDSQQVEVISVWGMGGLGKTTLVKDIYHSQELNGKFEKCACVTVMRPFSREELLRSLVTQPGADTSEKKDVFGMLGSTKKTSALNMGLEDLIKELSQLLEKKKCLIVLDDLSSTAEWDLINKSFPKMENTSRIIVTTREENIAKHCSKKPENIYKLKGIQYKDAVGLFTKKVFKETVDLDEKYPELVEEAVRILKKCNGLPLAVVTIGGFLANQPKTAVEWRKFNEHISAELEMNPELQPIKTVLNKSYDGLPYHLKSCFLYLSIFPEDHKISRRRLVRRWTAEGYSREIRDKSEEEVADNYFMQLIQRSMILPSQQSIHSKKGVDSCQVHDLIREISISKSMEENLVFTLEEGCSLNSQGTVRHLAISSSWEGDESDFESTVDMSRIRSLTVFGKWRSFFISEKMRLLRVLDLENASGLVDHHLEQIGKLLHLRYLSLRGCSYICYLPNSLGNLRQIQTLDIRHTAIMKLPKSIINLRKLQCICAGLIPVDEDGIYEQLVGDMPKHVRLYLAACFAPKLLKGHLDDQGSDLTRRDVCNTFCCFVFPIIAKRLDAYGVTVPRGIRKLKALHTLGVVNIAQGKPILREIKRLTRLRKLGVTGVNKKNGEEFCSAIAGLSHLESLSVRSEGEPGLSCCLDGLSSPPENLQSLKLYGNLVKMPEWIQGLKNLVKLKLRSTRLLDHDAALQVLGNLPKLAILRLCNKSFQGEDLRLYLHPEAFLGLTVLQLDDYGVLKSVEFEQGATPKLELLQIVRFGDMDGIGISGLSFLPSLKQVQLEGSYTTHYVENVRGQLQGFYTTYSDD